MAISAREITMPSGVATSSRCPVRKWIGLTRSDAMSWAWMLAGLLGSKKFGLASFCMPANRNVTPMNSRSGSRAHPARAQARGGGFSRVGEELEDVGSVDLLMPNGRTSQAKGTGRNLQG